MAIIITLIFLFTGIAFLLLGWVNYDLFLFILLPIVLGMSVGTLENRKIVLVATALTTLFVLAIMYIPGLSGLLCIAMALPIILCFVCVGVVISYLYQRYHKIKSSGKFPVLLLPLLPFILGAPLQHYFHPNEKEVVEVSTSQVFNYTPTQVYDAIKSVDTLIADKPYLMQFDLPIPTKCVLEKEAVGGLRTCYFRSGKLSNADFGSGTIVERITQLEKAKVLRMDVINYNLVGRKWIGFKEAIYYFDSLPGNRCKMTRITTYTSELSPRWYWEPLEKLGIRQEHDYVFANLENDLKKNNR